MDKYCYRHLIECRKSVIENLKHDIKYHGIEVDLNLVDDLDNDTIIGLSYLNQCINNGIIVPDYGACFKDSSFYTPVTLYHFKANLSNNGIDVDEEVICFHERCKILAVTVDIDTAFMLKMKYY